MARCGVVCVRTNGWNGLTGQENGSQARQLDTRKHGERKTLNLHHAADTPRLSNIFCQDSEWLIFCFCKPAFLWDMKEASAMFFPASANFCSIIQCEFSYNRDFDFVNLKLMFWWPVERLWFLAQKCLKKSLVTYSNSRYFSIPMFFKTG